MKTITPIIDYGKIAQAKIYYETRGFLEIAVPWILDYEAYRATRPPDRKEFYSLKGYLNASGEQSFLQCMLAEKSTKNSAGKSVGKNLCITTCFRDEPILDDIHHTYFVKVELINTRVTPENLQSMIAIAKQFFEKYVAVDVVQTDTSGEMFDIIDSHTGTELGSYGIRRYKKYSWIYGTGLALPRLDTVIKNSEKLKQKGK